MSAHTPGPWSAEIYREGAFDICAEKAFGGCLVLTSRSRHMSRADEMHANARLIAAAPELLEALQNVLGTLVAQFPHDVAERMEVVVDTRAVIAKVKGEA